MLSGKEVFKLMDTHGLPLDIINMMLREKGDFFNIKEFIEEGHKSKWTRHRLYQTLISSTLLREQELETLGKKILEVIDQVYETN